MITFRLIDLLLLLLILLTKNGLTEKLNCKTFNNVSRRFCTKYFQLNNFGQHK